MAIHLNIGNESTIKYRTDCFGEGSRTDFHLRGCNVTIPDAIDSQDNFYYDVGSYGSMRDGCPQVRNTFVCDNLLMNGSFQDPSIVQDSVYYNELLFSRPMIALYRSSISGYSDAKLTIRSDTFLLIDKLYTDLQYKECMGIGTRYSNGTPSSFNGIFDTPSISTQESIVRMSLLLESLRVSTGNWNYIASADKLKSFFPNGDRFPAFWNQILQCEYGACYSWNRPDFITAEPMIIKYQVETQSGNIEISNFPYRNFKFYYIIPFVSQDEYNAAYAANYRWEERTIANINKYYFNKFE